MFLFALFCSAVIFAGVGKVVASTPPSPPLLNIDGFSWAENLAFDGLGGLFVSESVKGQLLRISYRPLDGNYSVQTHLGKGFSQFGGLAVPSDGKTIFAAAVKNPEEEGLKGRDENFVVVQASTSAPALPDINQQDYSVIASGLEHLCNGLALVEKEGALYGTSEKGFLTRIEISTGQSQIVANDLKKPDGLWHDEATGLLFIGELLTMTIRVFNLSSQSLVEQRFPGPSAFLKVGHMLDDFTLVGSVNPAQLGATRFVGADWFGKQVVEFSLDGTYGRVVPPPPDVTLFQPTSLRRGKGFGFSEDSFYLTEGGGVDRKVSNRRVLQLPPGSI